MEFLSRQQHCVNHSGPQHPHDIIIDMNVSLALLIDYLCQRIAVKAIFISST